MISAPAFLFVTAVVLLLVAHGARAVRWALLFPKGYLTGRLGLLLGLGLGYAVNALLPLRIGEVLRAAFVTRREKVRFSYVLATIFAERTADLLVLALIIAVAALFGSGSTAALVTAGAFTASASLAVGLAVLIRRSAAARSLAWKAVSIFNDPIRLGIADFIWSSAELLAGGVLVRWRFASATAIMWSLYAASYACLGRAIGAPVLDVLTAILQQPLQSLAAGVRGGAPDQTGLFVFAFTPILLILGYGLLMQNSAFARGANLLLRHGRSGRGSPNAQRDRFSAASGYESFLGALFSGDDKAISGFGMEAVDDCIVHRFFNGGSDALTAVVETNQHLLIRKFAVGAAASKLRIQADWLRAHGTPDLPLVEVIGERQGSAAFSYDMPLVTPANDFYDVIHSSPTDRNRSLLCAVLNRVAALHMRTAAGEVDERTVAAYLHEKATRNAQTILQFAKGELGRSAYSINGVDHDLGEWDRLMNADWLARQVRDRRVATIHGDMTIENVIVAPNHPAGFYIIDPNPENIFDTPLIDWAKVMQSLHLGYETLNRGISCSISGTAVSLSAARSQAYAELHATAEAEVRARYGEDGLREVYFHEMINYLRLTTYKIRQSHQRGLGFFACTSILLRRYQERFG